MMMRDTVGAAFAFTLVLVLSQAGAAGSRAFAGTAALLTIRCDVHGKDHPLGIPSERCKVHVLTDPSAGSSTGYTLATVDGAGQVFLAGSNSSEELHAARQSIQIAAKHLETCGPPLSPSLSRAIEAFSVERAGRPADEQLKTADSLLRQIARGKQECAGVR